MKRPAAPKKIRFKVEEGCGGVYLNRPDDTRKFLPGEEYETTPADWHGKLKYCGSLKIIRDKDRR